MTTLQSTNQQGQNLKAASFMLGSVFCYSLVPLAIARLGGTESPFLFNSGWRSGVSIGCLIFLFGFYRPALLNRDVLWLIARRAVSSTIFLIGIINTFYYALFAWSTQYIDISVATILLETWPIGFILFMALLFRHGEAYRRNIRAILPLLLLAFVGVAFVITSQTGGVVNTDSVVLPDVIKGVFLALLASLSGALATLSFKWGVDLAKELPANVIKGDDNASLVLFGAVVGFAMIGFFGIPLNAVVGLSLGETKGAEFVVPGIIAGLLVGAPATILFRKANLATKDLGVNALGYAIPVVSLIWLAVFWEIEVVRTDFLIIGAAAIVAANLLISFEAERLLGFKALVISLWVCGTLVYLRDAASWGWDAMSDGYFDVLFLSATVFALILSFRTQRLASRTQEEDNRAFKVFRELEELARQGVISPRAYKKIPVIDEKQGRDLETAYAAARRRIAAALRTAEGPNRKKLIAASTDLDALAHSRQQGINFGEKSALFIFAGLVVGTALLSRPAGVTELTGFLVEMFAMLFPAVILFLAFNVVDLERDRVSQILKRKARYGGYGVAFQDTIQRRESVDRTSRRTVEQWISVAVGLALIVAYAGLFLYKWGLLHQWGILEDFPGRFPSLLS